MPPTKMNDFGRECCLWLVCLCVGVCVLGWVFAGWGVLYASGVVCIDVAGRLGLFVDTDWFCNF